MLADVHKNFGLPTQKNARIEVSFAMKARGRGLGGSSKEVDAYIAGMNVSVLLLFVGQRTKP